MRCLATKRRRVPSATHRTLKHETIPTGVLSSGCLKVLRSASALGASFWQTRIHRRLLDTLEHIRQHVGGLPVGGGGSRRRSAAPEAQGVAKAPAPRDKAYSAPLLGQMIGHVVTV